MGIYADITIQKEIDEMYKNHKPTPNCCINCGKSFKTGKSLAQHRHEKHGGFNPKCSCGRLFATENGLKQHQRLKGCI